MALQAVNQVTPIEERETMIAFVRIKHQYGQQVVEPVNDIANEFARIAGTKLLTQQTIDSMKRLGYRVEVEQTLPRTL
jgi:hypothetical protein